MVITEFDGFRDFIAIYCKLNGVPKVIVQDLNSKEFNTISVDNDIGEILPGLNQDYESLGLNFMFASPFVY